LQIPVEEAASNPDFNKIIMVNHVGVAKDLSSTNATLISGKTMYFLNDTSPVRLDEMAAAIDAGTARFVVPDNGTISDIISCPEERQTILVTDDIIIPVDEVASQDIFTGNVSVLPTCTYLGNYSLMSSSCKDAMLQYSGPECSSITLAEVGSSENAWFLSAVTKFQYLPTLPNIPTAGKVWAATCPLGANHLNFEEDGNGQVTLSIGSESQLVPVALDTETVDDMGFCSSVRLMDPSTGKYLAVEGCESPTFSFTTKGDKSTVWVASPLSSYELKPNHEEDADVSISLTDSRIEFFSRAPNSTEGVSTIFPEGFAHVGLDEDYNVIGFICPQSTYAGVTIEAQLGKVGGKVDPDTGAAIIALSDAQWLAWGDIPGPNGNITLTKENALRIPLLNATGGPGVVLSSATTVDTPEKTAVTLAVPASTGSPDPNTSPENLALLQEMGQLFAPMTPGAEIFWVLYLEAPENITGSEYKDFATEANQGTGSAGTAEASPPPASDSILSYPSWEYRVCAAIVSALFFF